jgi:hypothetical protein
MNCKCAWCTADRYVRVASWGLIVVGIAYFALRMFL